MDISHLWAPFSLKVLYKRGKGVDGRVQYKQTEQSELLDQIQKVETSLHCLP